LFSCHFQRFLGSQVMCLHFVQGPEMTHSYSINILSLQLLPYCNLQKKNGRSLWTVMLDLTFKLSIWMLFGFYNFGHSSKTVVSNGSIFSISLLNTCMYPRGTSNDAHKQIIVCYRLTIDCCFKISA
jgi:hypothetical protein